MRYIKTLSLAQKKKKKQTDILGGIRTGLGDRWLIR